MRELMIKRITEWVNDGLDLDEYDLSLDEMKNLSDEDLLDLFQELVFPG